jgi:hypothetical protein
MTEHEGPGPRVFEVETRSAQMDEGEQWVGIVALPAWQRHGRRWRGA